MITTFRRPLGRWLFLYSFNLSIQTFFSNINLYKNLCVSLSSWTKWRILGVCYIVVILCLPLSRGNVACDKGVEIPLGSAVSPFEKGEQRHIRFFGHFTLWKTQRPWTCLIYSNHHEKYFIFRYGKRDFEWVRIFWVWKMLQ